MGILDASLNDLLSSALWRTSCAIDLFVSVNKVCLISNDIVAISLFAGCSIAVILLIINWILLINVSWNIFNFCVSASSWTLFSSTSMPSALSRVLKVCL